MIIDQNSGDHVNFIYRTCLIPGALLAGLFLIPSLAFGQGVKSTDAHDEPLIKLLYRFEMPSVSATSPEEVEPLNFHPGEPQPEGLPGNGIAQHPMLYIGEGYTRLQRPQAPGRR